MASSAAGAAWTSTRDEGFRAAEPEGERRAVVLPPRARRAVGHPGRALGARARSSRPASPTTASGAARTAAARSATRRVLLVRHRGEHRIADAFCGVDHLLDVGQGRRALALSRPRRSRRRRRPRERAASAAPRARERAPSDRAARADEERDAPVGRLDERARGRVARARAPMTSAVIGQV